MDAPETRYAKSGDLNIAYQVLGEGPIDLVYAGGFATHLEVDWDFPPYRRFLQRLSSFARVLVFDKRGTGMSDPVTEVPTLEARMDDVRAVMDAAGSERAALVGHSEGAPMAMLFAATYPERTSHLVLIGAFAKSTKAEDYPFAPPAEAVLEAVEVFMAPNWGTGQNIEIFGPSLAEDPKMIDLAARHERFSASPAMAQKLFEMFLDIDVRSVVPTIRVPTLVLHRRGDFVVNWRAGKWIADRLPGARYVELEGHDHLPWAGDYTVLLDEVEEFITGTHHVAEPDRVLATLLFTDIVGSTQRAAKIGDRRWRDLLDDTDRAVHDELERFRGRLVKTTGDGHLATFDGPARAIQCGSAIVGAVRPLGIELRIGLHAGEIELMEHDVGGIAVHLAARVMSLAGPGEVLVSSTVKDLVAGSGIEFQDRGVHELKGVPGEWQLFAVKT